MYLLCISGKKVHLLYAFKYSADVVANQRLNVQYTSDCTLTAFVFYHAKLFSVHRKLEFQGQAQVFFCADFYMQQIFSYRETMPLLMLSSTD